MKYMKLAIAMVLLLCVAGCTINASPEWMARIDTMTGIQTEMAVRARAGEMTTDEMADALWISAEGWKQIQATVHGQVREPEWPEGWDLGDWSE